MHNKIACAPVIFLHCPNVEDENFFVFSNYICRASHIAGRYILYIEQALDNKLYQLVTHYDHLLNKGDEMRI